MEQRLQRVNTSQTERGINLYDKANMKRLFVGLREHTRACVTRESGRKERGDETQNIWLEYLSFALTWVMIKLTVLSRPNIMIMRKKMMEKNVAAGMFAKASA